MTERGNSPESKVPAEASLRAGTLLEEMQRYADSSAVSLLHHVSGRTVTYLELIQRIEHTSQQLGTDDRKLVFLRATSTVDTVLAYLALLNSGHVVYLLNENTNPSLLENAVAHYSPDMIIGTAVPLPEEYARADSCISNSLFVRRKQITRKLHPDLAVLLSTSGTTGSCKLVRLSNRNTTANAVSIRSYLGLTPQDRAITMLPLSYSYGLSVLHSHLAAGGSIVLNQEPVTTRDFWCAFNKLECTSLSGVPHTHQTLLKLGIFRKPPRSLRYVTQAGGRLEPSTTLQIYSQLKSHAVPLFVMYGQTEATARMSYLPPDQLPHRIGSIGKAIPNGGISIVREDGTPCDLRQIGEVVYRGPNVMMGYANNLEDLARGDELSGVLRTGDLGYADEDGYFFLTGRLKRVAKVVGLRISLDEVEALFAETYPMVVVDWNHSILCFVEAHHEFDIDTIRVLVCEKLALSSDYVHVKTLPEFPRTSNGKIDYQRLQAP